MKYIYIVILILGFSCLGFLAGNQEAKFKPNPQESAEANEEQEFATYVIGGGTLLILMIQCIIFARQETAMQRQTALTDRQTTIAYQTYIATHRPKLIVRNVSLERDGQVDDPGDRGYRIDYTVTNVGGSNATIIAGGFISHKWRRLLQPFTVEPETTNLPSKVSLQPGETVKGHAPIKMTNAEISETMLATEVQKSRASDFSAYDLIFRGSIIYVDDNGIKRCTAVWRTCAGPPTLRMIPTDNTDYEYAD